MNSTRLWHLALRSLLAALWLAAATAHALPTEAFARLPQLSSATLSPDGTWFAALVPKGQSTVAVARPLDGKLPPKALFEADNREFTLAWVRWASNERLVISIHYADRRGQTDTTESRLVAVNRDGSKLVRLNAPNEFRTNGGASQFQDQVIDWLPEDGHHVLLQASNSLADPSPSVLKVDLDTAEREIVHGRRFGVRRWWTDRSHRVRVGLRQQDTKVEVIVCDPDGERWRTAWAYDLFDAAAVEPLGFGTDPHLLYVTAAQDGRRAVFVVDLRDAALPKKLLLAYPDQDVAGGLLRDPVNGRVLGLSSGRFGDAAAGLWDADAQKLARAIDAALPGRSNRLLQFTADGSHYLLFSSGNAIPGQFMVGDRASGQLSLLAKTYPEIAPQATASKQAITVRARDGLAVPGYLTLPMNAPARNLPTVILPHGGPISADTLDFDPLAAFLADRGYAVLQVNFRGSAGLGFEYRNAGLQRWGREMQDDLTDAVRWLEARGTADPQRVCIVGGSYGGYAALMGGASTPELYRCVVSLAGVSDLPDFASWRAKYINGRAVFQRQVGADSDALKETSPRRLAAQFKAPVLLLHGTDDRSVPYAQSVAMDEALAQAGKPHRLVTLEGGDHFMSDAAQRLQIYREIETFLAQHMQAAP
jgi:dipeptidyl aminopeptidase/acylaminoacyl peptidase